MTREQYIGKAIKEMVTENVTISFVKRKNISKLTSSYFFPDNTSSKFIINYFENNFNDGIFPYFLHEFCHFKQWKEGTEIWKKGQASLVLFDMYLNHTIDHFTKSQLLDIQSLELDCEKRVIAEIKKYKLPINISKYVNASNSYIYSYNLMLDTRDYNENIDCYSSELLSLVPSRLFSPSNIQKRIRKYDNLYMKMFE